jgi:hypothetical protein
MMSQMIALWMALFFLLLFGTPRNSSAEISYLQMKGIHSLLRPECEDLSPIHGFNAIKTDVLANVRFYGNYGPPKEPYGCHPQIRAEQRNQDCPQDWIATLVQQLFPAPDGVNLVANQGAKSDLLSQLDPAMIGRLLETIKFSENQIKEHEMNDDWTLAVFQALNPVSYQQEEWKVTKGFKKAS